MISCVKNLFITGMSTIAFLFSCQQPQAARFVSEEQHQDHLKKLQAINAPCFLT
jgi:hypothetical protein